MDTKIKVYIAAGWFSPAQDKALTFLEEFFTDQTNSNQFSVYSPRKEIVAKPNATTEEQKEIYTLNCKNIEEADLIVVSTVDKDMGTLFESGYAAKCGKPIVYTLFDERLKNVNFNLMLSASGIAAFTDQDDFILFMLSLTKDILSTRKVVYKGLIE